MSPVSSSQPQHWTRSSNVFSWLGTSPTGVQTVTCILRSYLNNCLVQANIDVRLFRTERGENILTHLQVSTPGSIQPLSAQCPSRDHYPIQCPCQERSVPAKLKGRVGVNLALLPVALIQIWLRAFNKMFRGSESPFKMTVKIAWGGAEKNTSRSNHFIYLTPFNHPLHSSLTATHHTPAMRLRKIFNDKSRPRPRPPHRSVKSESNGKQENLPESAAAAHSELRKEIDAVNANRKFIYDVPQEITKGYG